MAKKSPTSSLEKPERIKKKLPSKTSNGKICLRSILNYLANLLLILASTLKVVISFCLKTLKTAKKLLTSKHKKTENNKKKFTSKKSSGKNYLTNFFNHLADSNILLILFSILTVIISFYAFEYIKQFEIEIKSKTDKNSIESLTEKYKKENDNNSSLIEKPIRPKYWFYMSRQYMWIFVCVDNVLKRLGLEKIEMEFKQGEKIFL
jgi:hypothetical protein